jgi:hypothetical protein
LTGRIEREGQQLEMLLARHLIFLLTTIYCSYPHHKLHGIKTRKALQRQTLILSRERESEPKLISRLQVRVAPSKMSPHPSAACNFPIMIDLCPSVGRKLLNNIDGTIIAYHCDGSQSEVETHGHQREVLLRLHRVFIHWGTDSHFVGNNFNCVQRGMMHFKLSDFTAENKTLLAGVCSGAAWTINNSAACIHRDYGNK